MSRSYAEVIGDPIAHSKSPAIHGFWLERLGINAEYRACHVRSAELGDYLAKRRMDPDWRGCNVTIPHKQAVMPFLDEIDVKASRVGAVNTILSHEESRLAGTNTDVDGVDEAIQHVEIAGGIAVVLGAGGAARAAFAHLAEAGAEQVRVMARSADKAVRAASECRLEARIFPFAQGSGAFDGASLLINATQLGMESQQSMPPFVLEEIGAMAPGGLVFDMVYTPLETGLLKAARGRGLATSDGLVMLMGQAATAFEKFFGVKPPRDEDAQLRAKLLA